MAGFLDENVLHTYTAFSGADIVATFQMGDRSYVFGELSTISYSIHREKVGVRRFSTPDITGWAKGPRTIAGSLIFTVFDRHVFQRYLREVYGHNILLNRIKVDDIPEFNVLVTMANEYGQIASVNILGIQLLDEGQTMSVEDLVVENTMSYMARDVEYMTPLTAGTTALPAEQKPQEESGEVMVSPTTLSAKVLRIVDGDTVVVQTSSGIEHVRLIGLNTPEVDQDYYQEAAAALAQLLPSECMVTLELDLELRDVYGRLLAYVRKDGKLINALMLQQGWGKAIVIPPNTRYANLFSQLEAEAKDAKRNIWSEGSGS